MANKRPDADFRFRKLIDEFNLVDSLVRTLTQEREILAERLRNVVRRRGRGVHNGNESSIKAHDIEVIILRPERVKAKLPPRAYAQCLKKKRQLNIEGGPLVSPSKELPDMGPPEVISEERQ